MSSAVATEMINMFWLTITQHKPTCVQVTTPIASPWSSQALVHQIEEAVEADACPPEGAGSLLGQAGTVWLSLGMRWTKVHLGTLCAISDWITWRKRRKNMHPKFRKLVIATATVIAVAGTTVALPGSAEARWRGGGWGWGGFGIGLGTGLLLATAARPYYGGYYGYPAYGYGYGYPAYGYGYGYPAYGYGYRRAYYGGYYARYRYAGYPYRRAYYGYGGYYPYR
jgi:hypothetical protein